MSVGRRILRQFVFIWLAAQMAAFAAPVVLAAAGSQVVDELCTCAGGDHETCPMHHGSSSQSAPSVCGMRSAATPLDLALLSMAGGSGVLPSHVEVPMPRVGRAAPIPEPASLAQSITHDTPPPRS